ncbi:sodium/hydrogen exchanger 9B2-like isoform X2 [Osmerus eperlanus]|uniref:sodium/hydrogen exchanger 9B2-like isoform X2 n=1 Tax=Osmerus eperlanus TaxID=29151 RepID=UPI002E14FE21
MVCCSEEHLSGHHVDPGWTGTRPYGSAEAESGVFACGSRTLYSGGLHSCSGVSLPHGAPLGMGLHPGKDGYGVEKGIPTLLMTAGRLDAVLAITGFTTCLAMASSKDSTWMNKGLLDVVGGMGVGLLLGIFICFFPSKDQEDLVLRRCVMLLGLSLCAVFGSRVVGFPGAGSVCTLVMAFLAALGWGGDKAPVAAMVGRAWDIFQPLLFGLIGAEITVSTLDPNTVGLGMACLCTGLLVRLLATFLLVHFGGFTLKEKIFISVAWIPKDTVQAALGSAALDMALVEGDEVLVKLGLDVLTVAVLAILTTAPVGALGIGLAGPRLLHRHTEDEESGPTSQTKDMIGQKKDFHESKL